ncbi:MAG: hypothetical protein ACHQ1D_00320 [Nitrososphaerales archaeon]
MDKFSQQVYQDHKDNPVGGHDLLHAFMVHNYCVLIAPDDNTSELAGYAAMLHNYDRMYKKESSPSTFKSLIYKRLNLANLSIKEKKTIYNAVLQHSKLNSDQDDLVTITLKDADRLANLGASFLIRLGQFIPHLPFTKEHILEKDPKATYSNPVSLTDQIHGALEWEDMLRLPKAKELARPHFNVLRLCLDNIYYQMKELGLTDEL